MEQYSVTGMSCAACQARVEKAVSKVPGVTACSVSLLTNSMGVEGTASAAAVIAAVQNAGYGAAVKGASQNGASSKMAAEEEALKDHDTPVLRRRLIASVGFLLVLMYFSMGHMMWGWPVPAFFQDNHVAMGLLQLLLAAIVMVINQKFFISGFKGLLHGAPNMDTLIALGSSAAFGYSTVMLFAMTYAQVNGGTAAAMEYMEEFYFESAAMILALITVGKMLEAHSKGKTTNALRGLMQLAPKTAVILRDGQGIQVPIEQVCRGDVFVVRPGETIPVDGIVLEGCSAVNEAALTGESIPVDKKPGDSVTSATLNQSGYLRCEATRVGEDTTLSQIIRMVSDAAATKAPVAKLADKISGVFVPCVIGIAVVTLATWLIIGRPVGFALARAICVLVVSCPCALGLATPVAIMVGSGVGARNGILFKNAQSLQETGNIRIAALDKTGTITEGRPRVTDVIPAQGLTELQLLQPAAAVERMSEHPLAAAVAEYAAAQDVQVSPAEQFRALVGSGVTAVYEGRVITGGSMKYMETQCTVPAQLREQAALLAEQGKTPLCFAADGEVLGVIAVADTIKEDSAKAIARLRKMGVYVVMLTGDNRRTAEAIGAQAGVDEVIAGVLPGEKEAVIRQLQQYGKTAMIGDGINDAPALTRADIGIAIGAGSDVAIDAADVVLMKSTLADAAAAVSISRHTYKNIVENLFWALIYNTLLIPAAAGVYTALGVTMNPMLGAAAMSLSSFCVVTNALRLNLLKVHNDRRDRKCRHAVVPGESGRLIPQNSNADEGGKGNIMTKTIHIEGMMCTHCEASVKKALEALAQVESAEVSHTAGTAVVTLTEAVDDDVMKKAVEDKDYTVTGIE